MGYVDARLVGRPDSVAGVKLLALLGPLYMADIRAIEEEVELRTRVRLEEERHERPHGEDRAELHLSPAKG